MDHQSILPSYLEKIMENRVPQPEGKYTKSSVLVLIFPKESGLHVLFCQRSFHLKSQPGDICFPGGRREKKETPLETALREAWEEIGIPPEEIKIIGEPDFLVTPSGKMIFPFLGIVETFPFEKLNINPEEVEQIFLVPLSFFLETEPKVSYIQYQPTLSEDFPYHFIVGGKNYNWGIKKYPQLFYLYENFVIWGITARIMNNIKNIILAASE